MAITAIAIPAFLPPLIPPGDPPSSVSSSDEIDPLEERLSSVALLGDGDGTGVPPGDGGREVCGEGTGAGSSGGGADGEVAEARESAGDGRSEEEEEG